ncbi:mitochondrial ribosome assembly protein RRG9 Ecym_6458 [Eremothecium cymbalariae DBVPG|uniref:Required for respiratory growth protein 9, mitochondrial n=1 Tax=Eremothecium cymbalariae (strain CBS 270.75 / DBVPG 7215 / KCTC 17166 / NRRL Y-17582) TaxID=931890 RepID=G8JUP9_ERECY|nr:hypothetical protein Ecym_6458 [Eremothecium cymbalariae DBVPG\
MVFKNNGYRLFISHRDVFIRNIATTSTVKYNQLKTAKSIIKLVNNSSLSKKEQTIEPGIQVLNKEISPDMPEWKKQKLALNKKFKGEQWNPTKKLSRDEIESVRMLKRQYPNMTTKQLGSYFKVSPESVRRILKSKWQPTEDEMLNVQERWKRRGKRIESMFEPTTGKDSVQPTRRIVVNSETSGGTFRVKYVQKPKVISTSLPKPNKLHLLLNHK